MPRSRSIPFKNKWVRALQAFTKTLALAWIDACSTDDIDPDAVRRFHDGGRAYCIVRKHAGAYHRAEGR
jgi:hypothetical protein